VAYPDGRLQYVISIEEAAIEGAAEMIDGEAHAGSELAGYRVHEVIGRGGMGVVYRATDVNLDRPVALKVLRDGGALDEGSREQLLLESRRAASLDHPNVVPVYEAGESSGRLFFAMRFVPGTDLKSLLRREGALEPVRAIAIAAQVADALDAAHRRGLVHRDVKPSNVLLDHADEREHAYLADFGLTQLAAEYSSGNGHFTGSVDYAAPEQIRGERIDGRADQYGLACLLFECLTGTLPYRSSSDVAAIFAHLQEPSPSASERRIELPAAIDDVLARGMATEPGERFGSCSELVANARDALGLEAAPAASRRVVLALGALLAVSSPRRPHSR
jgi:serine/threonine protein kinase